MMPRTILHDLAGLAPVDRPALPLKRWAVLVTFAVGGSLLYGASLAWVLPGWDAGSTAVWLALSAAFAGCVFIPALFAFTELRWRECCDASLLTMAFGAVMLASGALVNALLRLHAVTVHAVSINCLIVAFSSIVVAAALARLLRKPGVPVSRTLTLWMFVFNGCGASFFFALYSVLRGW